MALRSDMALDAGTSGTAVKKIRVGDCFVTRTILSESDARETQKSPGTYITVETDELLSPLPSPGSAGRIIREAVKDLLGENTGELLVLCPGNRSITPDSLGPAVADKILATRHLRENSEHTDLRSVSVVAPGVLGQTGLETADIAGALVKKYSPAAVIAVDAFATSALERLGRCVQISDTGIAPGSGVQNSRRELSLKTLGVPVISVGVPTVADFKESNNKMVITPGDVDILITRASALIAGAINSALQPTLSEESIAYLLSR